MSFGFSVSDFLSIANVAYQIYETLKTGPGECQAFTYEMLMFYNILHRLAVNLDVNSATYRLADRAVLREHGRACYSFLWKEVLDRNVPSPYHWPYDIHDIAPCEEGSAESRWYSKVKCLKPLSIAQAQATVRNAMFARKIPKLRQLATAQIEKLTAYNVLLMQSSQTRMESAQTRIEASQKLLEDGQFRMESMLSYFLATQQSNGTPITSCSLESSSPEGIDACRSLYRALRKEGISSKKITDNQQILVKAMKRTLGTSEAEAQSLASTFCSSYRTAPEYIDNSILSCSRGRTSALVDMTQGFMPSSAEFTMSIYGSAPPTAPTFPQAFLERSSPRALEAEDDLNDYQDQDSDDFYTRQYSADNRDSEYADAERVEKTDLGPDLPRTSEQHRYSDLDEEEIRGG